MCFGFKETQAVGSESAPVCPYGLSTQDHGKKEDGKSTDASDDTVMAPTSDDTDTEPKVGGRVSVAFDTIENGRRLVQWYDGMITAIEEIQRDAEGQVLATSECECSSDSTHILSIAYDDLEIAQHAYPWHGDITLLHET